MWTVCIVQPFAVTFPPELIALWDELNVLTKVFLFSRSSHRCYVTIHTIESRRGTLFFVIRTGPFVSYANWVAATLFAVLALIHYVARIHSWIKRWSCCWTQTAVRTVLCVRSMNIYMFPERELNQKNPFLIWIDFLK